MVLTRNIPRYPWLTIPHMSASINGRTRKCYYLLVFFNTHNLILGVLTSEANDILDAWHKLKDDKEKEVFISEAENRIRAEGLKNVGYLSPSHTHVNANLYLETTS